MEKHHGNYGNKMIKDFWKDKKVLITGHTGFKGSWLSTWLISLGAEIIGISNFFKFKSFSMFHNISRMFVKSLVYFEGINK